MYVKPTETEEPAWINYFGANVDLTGIKLKPASSAAVLLVRRKLGTFALTSGYGRFLLNDEVIEPRFGLRATLNAIEPSMIRSIDHRRLDAVARHSREQMSRLSGVGSFGVGVERDLLRAVTGRPTDEMFGDQLSRADLLGSYPFYPKEQIEAVILAVMIVTVGTVIWMIVQISRNEIVSRIAGTTPGRITWDASFVLNLLLFGLIPLLSLLAAEFPAVRDSSDWVG